MVNLTRVAPELAVTDLPSALDYYSSRLGFEVALVMPEGDYAIVERDDVALHLFTSWALCPSGIHVFSSDLDALLGELERRGATIVQRIEHKPWGNREFRVADPAGNTIKFTEPVG